MMISVLGVSQTSTTVAFKYSSSEVSVDATKSKVIQQFDQNGLSLIGEYAPAKNDRFLVLVFF